LPKDALVEKQALFHTGRCMMPDDNADEELSLQDIAPIFAEGDQFHRQK
jgi:diphthine-ammonia ligase